MLGRVGSIVALCTLLGCGDDAAAPSQPVAASCSPPARIVGDLCIAPGMADDGCAAGSLGRGDGTCQPAGLEAAACGTGFAHDGDVRCAPVLPAEPCSDGLVAIPGDADCHPIASCAAGRWGDIPVDTSTQHVDASYARLDSDGSADKPWPTIGEAYAAAMPGQLIAVAEGTYDEDVVLWGKPARIWGVCPDKVVIAGTGVGLGALFVREEADGSEVRGVSLTGGPLGLLIDGAQEVTVEQIRVFDTSGTGIKVQATLGPTAATVRGSLVERARVAGIAVVGASVELDGTVVRDTEPEGLTQRFGRGLSVEPVCAPDCDPRTRGTVAVQGSVFERNHEVGVFVMGSDAVVDGTVVRDTLPDVADDARGRGIHAQIACSGDTCDPNMRATLDVRRSSVERSRDLGISIFGSDATIETTVVRETLPRASDQRHGWAIAVQPPCTDAYCYPAVRPNATIRSSLLEGSHEFGLVVGGGDLLVETTVVRDTSPRASDQVRGHGITIQLMCTSDVECDPTLRANATIVGSVVAGNHEAGVLVSSSDAVVEATAILATSARASDETFGDGLAVVSELGGLATCTVTSSAISDSTRAGVASFGGTVSLGSTAVACAAFELEGEPQDGNGFVFEDRGTNGCGCPDATGGCVAVSAGLAPPTALAPVE